MNKVLLFLLVISSSLLLVGCSSSDNSEPFIKGISDVANTNNNSEQNEENSRSEIVENQDPFGVENNQPNIG